MKEHDNELSAILIQLFSILDDRTIDAEEGILICRAGMQLLKKVREKMPKYWQRILIDASCTALEECAQFLELHRV
jgi:hypothetical protein